MNESESSTPEGRIATEDPRAGEAVRWEVLYDEIGERVFRMLHRMLGDPEEAADVAHEAFLRMHQSRAQFAGDGPLHAWAFRIAANLGRDALRRRSHRQRHAVLEAREARDRAVGARRDVERLSLSTALDELDRGHRAVLLLHDVDGYTHAEIAEMLNVAVGTSKARLSRARRSMRAVLGRRTSSASSAPRLAPGSNDTTGETS